MEGEQFVLDRAENPHPDMLAAALGYRAAARRAQRDWEVYRQAMCDATGEGPEAMERWLDAHE